MRLYRLKKGGVDVLNIGSNRECFFDTWLINTDKTTAEFRLHEPIRREAVMTHDAPWEGDGSDFHNFFFDDAWHGVQGEYPNGAYRMYYLGWQTPNGDPEAPPHRGISVCYAESPDGIHWSKPSLGVSEFAGSRENNIILGEEMKCTFDNFMVFRDDNPACPPEERYKGIGIYQPCGESKKRELWCWYSIDGIHFTQGCLVTDKGHFDSLNVIFWDKQAGRYRGYIRNCHNVPESGDMNKGIRDVRYMESLDFKVWTDPVLLDFGEDAEDYPLYTNVVQPYYRAPQIYIGFPSRYMERAAWNGSFEELCGKESRRQRMTVHPRYGLTATDCVFMCSRDGVKFHRFDEGFLRPGIENGVNWVYGDCYPARGMFESPSPINGAPPELSLLVPVGHWMNEEKKLVRYTLRPDGFASLYAGYREEKVIVTKPFVYQGNHLYVNFSTSARGYLYVTLTCDGKEYHSCETFGDALDRKVAFEADTVASLAGREVIMTVRMRDADLYAIRFGE